MKRPCTFIKRSLIWPVLFLLLFVCFGFFGAKNVRAAKQDADVVFIGDSYTYGLNFDLESTRVANPWANEVAARMGISHYLIRCRNGAGFLRTSYEGTNFYSLLNSAASTLNCASVQKVIILGGYNDYPYKYDDLIPHVRSAITYAGSCFPKAEILVGMVGWHTTNETIRNGLVNETLPAYRDGAIEASAIYMDGCEDILKAPYNLLASDDHHPNDSGQHAIANYVVDYLTNKATPLVLEKPTGLIKQNGSWVYLNQGSLATSLTRIVKSPADSNWYFVRNGNLDRTFTGVAKSIANNRWYFVRNGKLDWNFTGITKSVSNGRWYFVRRGKLDWGFTGFAKSIANNKWYFVRKGELDWKFTGLAKSVANGKWYYAKNGKLDWNYTGLAKSISNGKWYYVRKGALDWKFTGRIRHNGKLRQVRNGRLV